MSENSTDRGRNDGLERNASTLNSWQAIRDEILARIRSGVWPPGELIPNEIDLAREFGCARATVNRALTELAQNGIVVRRRRVGTRVAIASRRRGTTDLTPMRHEIETRGMRFGYKLRGFETVTAPAAITSDLGLTVGTTMLRVDSLFMADEKPYCFERRHIVTEFTGPLTAELLEKVSVGEWIVQSHPTANGQIRVWAECISDSCAVAMDVPPASPVVRIQRLAWLAGYALSHADQTYTSQHRLNFDF